MGIKERRDVEKAEMKQKIMTAVPVLSLVGAQTIS